MDRREEAIGCSFTSVATDSDLLSGDFDSHNRAANEAMTLKELTNNSYRAPIKLNIEQSQSPSSNHLTSPPAPAPSSSPKADRLSTSHDRLITSSPSSSRSIRKSDHFLLLNKKDQSNKDKNKFNSINSTTTANGWFKEHRSHSPSNTEKKAMLNLGSDCLNDAESHPITPNPSSQTTSPVPIGNEPLAQLLITLKEQNKCLIREIEDLRIKLEDAEGK